MNEPNQKLSRLGKIRAIYKKYKVPLDLPVFLTLFCLWQILVGSTFNPIPKNEDIKVLHGEIVRARSATPEFIVQLANGEKVEMQWPASYVVLDSSTSNGPYAGHNKELLGCQAQIHYDSMRFTFTQHLRIWELNCINKKLQVSSQEIIRDYEKDIEGQKFIWSWFLGFIYICSFIRFLYDRKNHS
jgi:hypothetical protein